MEEDKFGKFKPSPCTGDKRSATRQSFYSEAQCTQRDSVASRYSNASTILSRSSSMRSAQLETHGIGVSSMRKPHKKRKADNSVNPKLNANLHIDEQSKRHVDDIGGSFISRINIPDSDSDDDAATLISGTISPVSVANTPSRSDQKTRLMCNELNIALPEQSPAMLNTAHSNSITRLALEDNSNEDLSIVVGSPAHNVALKALGPRKIEFLEDDIEEEESFVRRRTELFALFDKNGDGRVDCTELRKGIHNLGVCCSLEDGMVMAIIERIDTDNDKMLCEKEFGNLLKILHEADIEGGNSAQDVMQELNKVLMMREKRKKFGSARLSVILKQVPVITPDSTFRRWWDLPVICLCFYYWMTVSLALVFATEVNLWVVALDCVAYLVHVVDVFIELNTAYKCEGENHIVVRKSRILKHYIKTTLWIDCVSLPPFEVAMFLIWGQHPALWIWGRTKNLVYLYKLKRVFKVHDRGLMGPELVKFYFLVVPAMTTIWVILFLSHFLIILRIHISKNDIHIDDENCTNAHFDACTDEFYSQYLYAAFWCWQIVTSQGSTYITLEALILATVLMTFCLLLQGHVMAQMSQLLANGNVSEGNCEEMRTIRARLKHFGIPDPLQQEVLSFNFHTLGHSNASILRQTLGNLPEPIIRELFLYIKVTVIEGVSMFSDLEFECTLALANCLEQTYAVPEDVIIEAGSKGREMYFMMYGYADVVVNIGDGVMKSVAILCRGDMFGELALLKPNCARTATIAALSYCDLFVLHFRDFSNVQQRFQTLQDVMLYEAESRGLLTTQEGDEIRLKTANTRTRGDSGFGLMEVAPALEILSDTSASSSSSDVLKSSARSSRGEKVCGRIQQLEQKMGMSLSLPMSSATNSLRSSEPMSPLKRKHDRNVSTASSVVPVPPIVSATPANGLSVEAETDAFPEKSPSEGASTSFVSTITSLSTQESGPPVKRSLPFLSVDVPRASGEAEEVTSQSPVAKFQVAAQAAAKPATELERTTSKTAVKV